MKKLLTLLSVTAALGVCATPAADAPEAGIVVAQDGSGDYTRVQDAIDAAPPNQTARTIIYIKPGTYKEKLVVSSDRPNLMFVGQSYENTILTYDDYAGKTSDYASTRIKADDVTAVGITFQNTIDSRAPGIKGGQAAALRVDGDRIAISHHGNMPIPMKSHTKLLGIICLVLLCHGIVVEPVSADNSSNANAPDFSLVGFATVNGGTTGGQGGKTNIVATFDEFRIAAGATEPLNILVAGTLGFVGQSVKVAANKTIIGLGTNAGFVGHVYLYGVSNIILRNLTFTNPKGEGQGIGGGDGLTAYSTHHVWVDHCHFNECADGQFDITHGSDFFTVSWCRFSYTNAGSDHRLSMLIGNRDDLAAEDTGKLHVTLHHNWIGDLVQERTPRVRFGQVHVFNTYYAATSNNTCIGLGILSQVLLESSYFDGIKRPWKSRSEPGQTEGRLQTNDDMVYTFGPKIQMGKTAPVDFKPPYAYKLDAAKDVKDIVMKNAGVGRGPFAPK